MAKAITDSRGVRLFWWLHRRVFRLTRGRVGARVQGLPVLMLTTVGRSSGQPRDALLHHLEDGGRFVVVGSAAGRERPPAWWWNLERTPQASVLIRGRELAVEGHTATGAERERLWAEMVAFNPAYATYQERVARELPVVVLEPRSDAS